MHVTGIADGTQAGARVTIEYAVQPAAGAAFGAAQSVALDGRTAPVYFDFEAGVVSEDLHALSPEEAAVLALLQERLHAAAPRRGKTRKRSKAAPKKFRFMLLELPRFMS